MQSLPQGWHSASLHPLLECLFIKFGRELRAKCPRAKIGNKMICRAAISEFARHELIELVDARDGIPSHVSEDIAERVRLMRHQPVWVPSAKLIAMSPEIVALIQPYMRKGKLKWEYNAWEPRVLGPWLTQTLDAMHEQS